MANPRNSDPNQELASSIPAQAVMESNFAESKVVAVETIRKHFTGTAIEAIDLGAGTRANNTNIRVSNSDTGAVVVVQMGEHDLSSDVALQQLNRNGRPTWLPKTYGEIHTTGGYSIVDAKNNSVARASHGLNPFTQEVANSLTIVEFCRSTLEKKVADLHNPDKKPKDFDGTMITMAMKLGKDVSEILTTLSNNNIVWTDMKAGNLLIRPSTDAKNKLGELVVTDTKGFCPVNMLPMHVEGTKSTVNYSTITDCFLSRNFLDVQQQNTPSRYEARRTFEKEYSYTLGVLLYNMATNLPRANKNNIWFKPEKQGPEESFNWEHDNFKTKKGQRLLSIIKRLTDDNPDKRLHHTDAAALLQTIQHKKAYNTANGKVRDINDVISDIIRESSRNEITPAMIADVAEKHIHRTIARHAEKEGEKHKDEPNEVKGAWEQEFSLKLANMIYNSYTNPQPYFDPKKAATNVANFDFSHPVFQTEKGPRLRSIIERLSKSGPEAGDRLKPHDAAALLTVIDDKDKYDKRHEIVMNLEFGRKVLAQSKAKEEVQKESRENRRSSTLSSLVGLFKGNTEQLLATPPSTPSPPVNTSPQARVQVGDGKDKKAKVEAKGNVQEESKEPLPKESAKRASIRRQ